MNCPPRAKGVTRVIMICPRGESCTLACDHRTPHFHNIGCIHDLRVGSECNGLCKTATPEEIEEDLITKKNW